MGNIDSLGTGSQNPKPVNDKSGYRLFPTANQQPHLSPKTLQQQTLQRNTSFKKRRSVSLDDSSRPHGVARMPFARPSDAPAPRLQDVPANRMKASRADGHDRTRTSNSYAPNWTKLTAPKSKPPRYSPTGPGSQRTLAMEDLPAHQMVCEQRCAHVSQRALHT